jgi:hypothetical protein
MSNIYEEYNRENAGYQRRWADDAACRLPSLAKYSERFYKAYEAFRAVVLEHAHEDTPLNDYMFKDLISIKKNALLNWEKTVALDVMQIKRHGNDRDKAILKENMYWIRGTRSVDELFNNRTKDGDDE